MRSPGKMIMSASNGLCHASVLRSRQPPAGALHLTHASGRLTSVGTISTGPSRQAVTVGWYAMGVAYGSTAAGVTGNGGGEGCCDTRVSLNIRRRQPAADGWRAFWSGIDAGVKRDQLAATTVACGEPFADAVARRASG